LNQVFDERKRRARGLWEHNVIFYTQIDVNRDPIRLKLEHATTVPQEVTAQQVLKAQHRSGTLKRPADASVPEQVEAGTKTLDDGIQFHKGSRGALKDKDPATCERENSGLTKLSELGGSMVSIRLTINFDLLLRSGEEGPKPRPRPKLKRRERDRKKPRLADVRVIWNSWCWGR
jgi:hypothetical protein